MRKVAFVNEKGGSSKTTFAVNTAAYFALVKGKRVLLIDTDPQGQVARSLGLAHDEHVPNLSDLILERGVRLRDVIHSTRIDGLFVVPSDRRLNDFPLRYADRSDRFRRLSKVLAGLDGFDFVLFDTPPSMGLITQNVILASEEIVIPVPLTYLALDGCAQVIEVVEQLKTKHRRDLPRIALVVPTFYRPTRMANAILEKLSDYFGRRLASTVVRFNVRIDEAQSQGLTIWEYAPKSTGAQMLSSVADEIYRAVSRRR